MKGALKWVSPSLILIATLLVSLLASALFTLRVSRQTVERYVFVWEEEVARNMLVHDDVQLFERIQNQIIDLAPDVESTGLTAEASAKALNCFSPQTLQVTLYGTPAGELQICRSPEKLLLRSLLSPVFSFGILLGLLFLFWRLRRLGREESQRALNELAVRVAHDIRAPLMALQIAAERLTREPAREGTSETNVLISRASLRISAIADDLLMESRKSATSKPEAAAVSASVAADRFTNGIATVNSKVGAIDKSSAGAKTIEASIHEIIREKKMTSPSYVTFDVPATRKLSECESPTSSNDFERVISNLIQNAIEATKTDAHTKPLIVVETVESENQISVTIRDNGVGIPKDILPKIGDIGFSFGKNNGNGVGLSSARRWARDRGGDVDIRSLEGTGTEVRLTLPRRQIQADLQ